MPRRRGKSRLEQRTHKDKSTRIMQIIGIIVYIAAVTVIWYMLDPPTGFFTGLILAIVSLATLMMYFHAKGE